MREKISRSALSDTAFPPLSPRDSKENNLKSSENLAIIYIESEREK